MIAAILRKHGVELRGRWLGTLAFNAPPVAVIAFLAMSRPGLRHYVVEGLFALFALLTLAAGPGRYAGTGLATSPGRQPQRGIDPSLLFTLSLPVRRRTLFLWRAVSGIVAMETALAGFFVEVGVALVLSGVPWHVIAPALWLLLAGLPLYFLDSLLLQRFDEVTTLQIQVLCFMTLAVGLALAGVLKQVAETALHHFTSLPVMLAVSLLSAAFAAAAVWRLDRQSY